MPDIAAISTILSSVKTATDLAKLIKNSELSLSDAETKLQVAELIISLADVKIELADVQQQLIDKDSKIRDLEQELTKKNQMKYDGKFYWAKGDEVPFCAVCHEKDNKNHHLTFYRGGQYSSERYICKVCDNTYYTNKG